MSVLLSPRPCHLLTFTSQIPQQTTFIYLAINIFFTQQEKEIQNVEVQIKDKAADFIF